MPINPMSSVLTLVIPLFFALAVVTAPPVTGAPPEQGLEAARGRCTGSFRELVRPAPRTVGVEPASIGPGFAQPPSWCAIFGPAAATGCATTRPDPFAGTPTDPQYCEYISPAPLFVSPNDSELCGLHSPTPLSVPSAG